jgi:hypothetical protein
MDPERHKRTDLALARIGSEVGPHVLLNHLSPATPRVYFEHGVARTILE